MSSFLLKLATSKALGIFARRLAVAILYALAERTDTNLDNEAVDVLADVLGVAKKERV